MSALCTQAHAWLHVGGESDEHCVVTHERCVHCGEERTTETPRGLSGLDRADIRGVLETYARLCEESADDARAAGTTLVEGSLRGRALRIRQLIALLAVLLLCACADGHQLPEPAPEPLPPPHDVYLDVPDEDVRHWVTAVDAWNLEVSGPEVLVLRDGPVGCGVHVEVADLGPAVLSELEQDGCVTRVRYAPGEALCTAGHVLGHVLGLPDEEGTPRSVMSARHCAFVLPNHFNGVAVRERWMRR